VARFDNILSGEKKERKKKRALLGPFTESGSPEYFQVG
jgi:hypothetical protein